jgi:hypothetical protein
MHKSSLKEMNKFFTKYPDPKKFYRILDIGSLRVKRQSTYYDLLAKHPQISCSYTGVDLVPGANVDIVIKEKDFLSLEIKHRYNMIISGQTLEHVENHFMFMMSLISVADPEGCLICLIAPGTGPEHHPPDYWRVLPDGMKTLFSWVNIKPLEIYNNGIKPWCDTVGIGEYKL